MPTTTGRKIAIGKAGKMRFAPLPGRKVPRSAKTQIVAIHKHSGMAIASQTAARSPAPKSVRERACQSPYRMMPLLMTINRTPTGAPASATWGNDQHHPIHRAAVKLARKNKSQDREESCETVGCIGFPLSGPD